MSALLNDIALFVEVAKHKNFSRAAEALHMPVSTLSRRVSQLERGIGVQLLKRSTRRVDLTEAGHVYFDRCRHLIAEAQIAHEQLLDVAQQPKGHLRVSMPTSFSLTSMPAILQEFSERYPDIESEFDLGIQPIDLLNDSFDLVIRIGRQADSGIFAKQLGAISLGLYASAQYLDRHGAPVVPADLRDHQCLRDSTSKEDSIWRLISDTQSEEIQVSGRIAVNNVSMLRRLADLGLGIVRQPNRPFHQNSEHPQLIRVLPEWKFRPIPLLALFPSRLMPVKTRVFIEFLQTKLDAYKA